MSRRVQRRPQVAVDLIEQADYIAHDNLDAALRYLDPAEATFRDLAQQSTLGSRCLFENPQIAETLRWRVRGFDNYRIFYRPIADGVEIVHVIHYARDVEAVFEDS